MSLPARTAALSGPVSCQPCCTAVQTQSALQGSGIPVPTHIKVNRDGLQPDEDPPGFVETEDYVELDGAHDAEGPHQLQTQLSQTLIVA